MEYYSALKINELSNQERRDLPGGFQCRGYWFDPWLES